MNWSSAAASAPLQRAGSRFSDTAALFGNIEWLRFAAAAAILLGHMAPHVWVTGGAEGGWLKAVWYLANAGPDVFFVISGTVIWSVTQHESGARAALRFISRRLARIYSHYWLFLGLAALQLWVWAPYLLSRKDWLRSILLWPQDIDTLAIPVTWALTHVLAFYLLIACWVWLRRSASMQPLLLAALLVVLGNVYAIAVLDVYAKANLTSASWLWRLWLSPYQLEFIGGCLLAHLLARHQLPRPGLLLLAGCILIMFGCGINAELFDDQLLSGHYTPQRVVIYAPGAFLLVAACIGLQQSGRSLLPRLAVLLGAGTYSLYLLHTIALSSLYWIGFRDAMAGTGGLLAAYLLVAAVLAVISVAYAYYVEDPLNRRLFRWIDDGIDLTKR